jgi:hypothetical protein
VTADPFGDDRRASERRSLRLLGVRCELEADDAALAQLADDAYAGLPGHLFTAPEAAPNARIVLRRAMGEAARFDAEPPAPRISGGAGLLCATIDARNHATVSVATRSALVVIGDELLVQPYYARYELLEFALFTLASRSQQLVALHAACVARAGRGALLLGATGAGKSTLTLACLERGMALLSEDAVFVAPATLQATGIANFLHLRPGTGAGVSAAAESLEGMGIPIRRRSGVAKLEIDVRRAGFALAPEPARLQAAVCLDPQPGAGGMPLRTIPHRELLRRLDAGQLYATRQPGWDEFVARVGTLQSFELRRAQTPAQQAAQIDALLN